MTNADIIMHERIELMKEGIIGTTGRVIKVKTTDGNELTFNEPEEIHTFQAWKEMGYSVKKGEKAIAKFLIWKHTVKEIETDGENETVGKMFMKRAAFFSPKQVETIETRG